MQSKVALPWIHCSLVLPLGQNHLCSCGQQEGVKKKLWKVSLIKSSEQRGLCAPFSQDSEGKHGRKCKKQTTESALSEPCTETRPVNMRTGAAWVNNVVGCIIKTHARRWRGMAWHGGVWGRGEGARCPVASRGLMSISLLFSFGWCPSRCSQTCNKFAIKLNTASPGCFIRVGL